MSCFFGLAGRWCGGQNFLALRSKRRFRNSFLNLLFALDGFAARLGKTPAEPLDAARRIDQLLRAREEGMAIRTDVHFDEWNRRVRFELVAAGATRGGFLIVGVYSGLHNEGYGKNK